MDFATGLRFGKPQFAAARGGVTGGHVARLGRLAASTLSDGGWPREVDRAAQTPTNALGSL
jgi:hypothetical protein